MGINYKITVSTILSAVFINLVMLCLPCFATNVLLKWDPNTETNISGYKVYYKADSSTKPFDGTGASEGSSPIDVHNVTSTAITGLDPAHAYYFTITAYNTSGLESVYSSVVNIKESLAPSVSLLSPSNNSKVSGTVSVIANATDNVGVAKVEFYINGVLSASDTASPYLFSWDTTLLSAGNYVLFAKAYDAAGNVGQSENITVTAVKDVVVPTVAVTTPTNNATVTGTVTVSANASDNVGVTRVEFYVDGTLSAAANSSPYSYSWNSSAVTNGSHTLSAKSYDAAGNVSATSLIVVTVNNVSIQQSQIIPGDINNDGIVDVADALLALQIAVDNVHVSPQQLLRGDVAPLINGVSVPNGVIDAGDAIVILFKTVGKVPI